MPRLAAVQVSVCPAVLLVSLACLIDTGFRVRHSSVAATTPVPAQLFRPSKRPFRIVTLAEVFRICQLDADSFDDPGSVGWIGRVQRGRESPVIDRMNRYRRTG